MTRRIPPVILGEIADIERRRPDARLARLETALYVEELCGVALPDAFLQPAVDPMPFLLDALARVDARDPESR